MKEIIHNKQVITSVDKNYHKFIKWSIIFLLSLSWCFWRLKKRLKIIEERQPQIEQFDEEFSGSNWLVRRNGESYKLIYTSHLDSVIRTISITKEDFLLVKKGKISLESFYEKYNLI